MKKHYDRDERDRLAALESLDIMDTEPEPVYDEAVQLAAAICEAPVSLLTLLDAKRQWFKAKVGLDEDQTPRDQSFCDYAIREPELMLVPDARLDPRFRENPLVVGQPGIRFYAGMPIESPEGFPLGTLCVIDFDPRTLTNQQKSAMAVLARQISAQFTLRAQLKKLEGVRTLKKQPDAELPSGNALFRTFMDNCPLVGFMKDEQGRLLYYNRPFADRFEITHDAWIGKDDFALWPHAFASTFRAADVAVLRKGELQVNEESSPGPGGNTIYWRTYKFPILSASGEPLLAGMSLDITREKTAEMALQDADRQLREAHERLHELATTDSLTGLPNRRAFDERLREQLALAQRSGNPVSVLLLDVDDFKAINDRLGHEEGDAVLRGIASLLQEGSRSSDMACRYGGEEFALLLTNTPIEQALVVGDRLRAQVEDALWGRARVTVSGGAAVHSHCPSHKTRSPAEVPLLDLHASGRISGPDLRKPASDKEADERVLLRRADLALYRARALGKNRIVAFEPSFEAAELAS